MPWTHSNGKALHPSLPFQIVQGSRRDVPHRQETCQESSSVWPCGRTAVQGELHHHAYKTITHRVRLWCQPNCRFGKSDPAAWAQKTVRCWTENRWLLLIGTLLLMRTPIESSASHPFRRRRGMDGAPAGTWGTHLFCAIFAIHAVRALAEQKKALLAVCYHQRTADLRSSLKG